MKDCIFCKIANKEIPAEIVYEDSNVIAFLDNCPVNLGHTLVIPKKHFETIADLTKENLDEINEVVLKLSKAILNFADGLNVNQNNRKAGGQEVPHYHAHLIPRYRGDGHAHDWEKEDISDEQNKEFIEKVKKFL